MYGDNRETKKEHTQSVRDLQAVHGLLLGLKQELDLLHMKDPELHQLWLEVEWLRSNLMWDRLCLPTNWELFVFRVERGDVFTLRKYPAILRKSKELGVALRELVSPCS